MEWARDKTTVRTGLATCRQAWNGEGIILQLGLD